MRATTCSSRRECVGYDIDWMLSLVWGMAFLVAFGLAGCREVPILHGCCGLFAMGR